MNRGASNDPLRTRRRFRTLVASGSVRWGFNDATRGNAVEGGRDVAAGRKVGALAACLLVVAACSSGGNAAPESTAVLSTTGSTSPATRTPPTTSPPPSTTSSTTTPTTSTTTTTAAPPTTDDPAATAYVEVRAAVDRAIADFSECLLALPNCDISMLAATRGNPMLAINGARISEWNMAGYSVIDRDQFRYVIEAVELAADLEQATVTVCIADGTKLIHAGAAPDGSDIIIDDTYISGREAWDVRRGTDGVWRAFEAPAVGPTESSDVCPGA